MTKFRSLLQVHFVLPTLFILTVASDKAILYGNGAVSILILSIKKQCSRFFKKVFIFQKICFKVKVLKTLKMSSDCHIKICRSLKRSAILKIPSTNFRRTYALSVDFKGCVLNIFASLFFKSKRGHLFN